MPFIDIGNLFGNKKSDDAATPADGTTPVSTTTTVDPVTDTTTTTTTTTTQNAGSQTLEEYLAASPTPTTTPAALPAPIPTLPEAPAAPSADVSQSSVTTESVITFDSTPDVEDPDQPQQAVIPAVPVVEGTEVKQNGIREVTGPQFIAAPVAANPVSQLAALDMNAQIQQMNKLAPPTEAIADTVDGELLGNLATTTSDTVDSEADEVVTTETTVIQQPTVEPVPSVPPVQTVVVSTPAPVPEPISTETETVKTTTTTTTTEPAFTRFETSAPAEPVTAVAEIPPFDPVMPIIEPATAEAAPEIAESAKSEVEPVTPVEPVSISTPAGEPNLAETDKPAVAELQNMGERKMGLDELLAEAVRRKASDLHVSPGYRVILRIDGRLEQITSPVMDEAQIERMIEKLVPGTDPKTIKDIDMAYQTAEYRFRVNIFRQRQGLAIVFRVISSNIPALSSLNLPERVNEFIDISQGLILVTGPTGSGKSTTIAAILQDINTKKNKHIISIEDPVEYIYPKGESLIDQRNIKEDTDSWAQALRGALRQDPDIVLVGEMRDYETIAATLTIAETGHLVFATLHTNSAAQSIDRIVDVFPEEQQQQVRTQLANVLVAVISQRLIPISGGGRRAAVEIMIANSAVRTAIRESKIHQIDNIIQTSADIGMIAMEKSLVELVRLGLISTETAQYYSNKPDEVLRLLGGNIAK